MSITQKQLDANRNNAQKGGVKTTEGKAVSRYNAIRHGLLSKEVLLADEDAATFEGLCNLRVIFVFQKRNWNKTDYLRNHTPRD